MNPSYFSWWESIAISMILVGGLAWAGFSLQRWWKRHAFLRQVAEENKPPYNVMNNGWVVMDKTKLLGAPPLMVAADKGLSNNRQVDVMLGYLTPRYLHDSIRTVKSIEDSTTKRVSDDALRGLTIGSALFNYSIPKSFVLLDRRTMLMAREFVASNQRRYTVDSWGEQEPVLILAMFANWNACEKSIYPTMTKDTLLDFYHRWHPLIAHHLLKSTEGEYYPTNVCLVEGMLRQAKLSITNTTLQHMRAALTIMADILELEVPWDWLYLSDSVSAVRDNLLGVEAKRPTLTVVK